MNTAASLTVAALGAGSLAAAQSMWSAPDRAAKVAALIPGRKLPALTRDTLFADWTRRQVEAWAQTHPTKLSHEELHRQYAETTPTDTELLADFPRHISPLARVRTGTPSVADAAVNALYSYCPFCQSQSFSLQYDKANAYHATTVCCHTELYGRNGDAPPDYALKPTETVDFLHLDDTTVTVPCILYTDTDGVVWELYLKTLFDQRRWLDVGGDQVKTFGDELRKTGNPLYAHKLAILLNAVATTYYGLPLSYRNEVKQLTRAEWEASPRPNVFEIGPLGPWNRRMPGGSRGWLNMMREHLWAEPFALARHHPAFKQVSVQLHGDPEALDRHVTEKLMRELCLTFQSVFSQKLLTNYQDAIYMDLILMSVLAEDQLLNDLFIPAHEVTLYNHTYHDGLNGEGAPNYMAMPCGYFLPYLAKPDGWLRFYPDFLQDHPFYQTAIAQLPQLRTVRGLSVEFGDQHIHAYHPYLKNGLLGVADKAAMEAAGSRNWADYGVGILRVGGPGRRLELLLNYTRATLHNSQDALSIECWVDGVPVMRRGGYSAWWMNAALPQERPEVRALMAMDYPHRISELPKDGFDSWSWNYAHSVLCQNSATVDGAGSGTGWKNDRGYGEVVTFKGGEPPGTAGAAFQILDVADDYAWQQVNKPEVTGFRRTLIAVETADGRPYVLDLLKLRGGREHTLYNSAWAERAASVLPTVAGRAENLEEALPGGGPHRGTDLSYFRQIRQVERLARAAGPWELTWATDFAAYAPRPADGKHFVRPLADDDGKVRLRLIGLNPEPADTELISAKGPWLAVVTQSVAGNPKVSGVMGFENARDLLIERRAAKADAEALQSLFIHVLEGSREGDRPAVQAASLPHVESLDGAPRDLVAVSLRLANGSTDVVLYQSAPGVVRLPDGTETDARYALLRRAADGTLTQAEVCRGTFLRGNGLDHAFAGDTRGEIVDVIGDLTGTRQESALILKTDAPWPGGEALRGRQLLVTFESDRRLPAAEGYRIDTVTNRPDGTVRVDLLDHAPFIDSWHDVFELPAGKPGTLRTTRPLASHANSPWYHGMQVWFIEKQRHYAISGVSPLGGGHGGDTVELAGTPDLAADGIAPGDWFVVYGIRPGLKVNVAGEWRLNERKEAE